MPNTSCSSAASISSVSTPADSTTTSTVSSKASSPDTPVEDIGATLKRKNKRKISKSVDLDESSRFENVGLAPATTFPVPAIAVESTKTHIPAHLGQDNGLTKGMDWLASRSKVFVAIDLEYWEVNNKFLTEIGIAIYDTTQIAPNSHPILPKIKACHYVVAENKNKTNGKFVPNNMFKYSYGETLIMPMQDCKRAVEAILASYAKTNNLVIVGHAVGGDIGQLVKHGFKIPPHEVLDTMKIWRLTHKEGFGSLDKLLTFFDIPHGIMHNAGNDAYLNIHLFLALCDPEVRLAKKMDQPKDMGQMQINVPTSGKKKVRRRDSITHRSSNADDAIKLMI